MANPNGAKGSRFEVELLNGLRDHGFDVERLRLTGTQDQGDLRVLDGHHIVIEAKNQARIDLPGYLRELAEEKANYTKARRLDADAVEGVVIVKRRGKNWKEAYVVQTVRDYFELGEA
jgi:Holliday junction resolvase